jgi:hypothetical protein
MELMRDHYTKAHGDGEPFLMTMTTRQEAIKQIGKLLQLVANLGR